MATRARSRAASLDQLSFDADLIRIPEAATETSVQTQLAEAAANLRTVNADDQQWADSAYGWIRQLPPARRASAGQELVKQWAHLAGVPVGTKWEHGIKLGGLLVQTKMSTRWSDGNYVFQLPVATDADFVVLIGISPHAIHVWAVPPTEMAARAETVTEGKAWVVVDSANPPAWTREHGGGLVAAAGALAAGQRARLA